eukprot:9262698-Ditylum_brightwellii.AAC.1
MIRSFEVHDTNIDEKDPRTGILSGVTFATRATVHTTMQTTPIQLVFGRDTILNVRHETNWKYIQEEKRNSLRNIMRKKIKEENSTTTKWQTKY